jgi:hypothetical protein
MFVLGTMEAAACEIGGQAASLPWLASTLLSGAVFAAVVSQSWTTVREANTRAAIEKASLEAINCEFEQITISLETFWSDIERAWAESSLNALVKFCTLPYPDGSIGAWASSLRNLLPMLQADQIREKIELLYITESLNMLRKSLAEDYERFCIYEQSMDMSDGEEIKRMSIVQSNWTMTQSYRLVEYRKSLERLQLARNKLLSDKCKSI